MSMQGKDLMSKGFWQRPEGVTGMIFAAMMALAGGYFFVSNLEFLKNAMENTLYAGVMLMALAAIVYVILDPKARNLMWFGYKSFMRAITRIFVNIDPIGVLKGYIEHLEGSLGKMTKQMNQLRGQMHKLKELIITNQREIQSNLAQANQAKDAQKDAQMILKTRKAGRLTDSNMRLDDLYKRMETLYRILTKMHETSYVMAEDLKDQIMVKETERNAIMASHSAMQSAMSILTGNPDKKAMFDMALEAIATDVSSKMGEMENFMQMSEKIMNGIDLQNGVFEEEGLKMLEDWEKKGTSLLLGETKDELVLKNEVLDINQPIKTPERAQGSGNQYDSFFD
jgi:hypothetical protein